MSRVTKHPGFKIQCPSCSRWHRWDGLDTTQCPHCKEYFHFTSTVLKELKELPKPKQRSLSEFIGSTGT